MLVRQADTRNPPTFEFEDPLVQPPSGALITALFFCTPLTFVSQYVGGKLVTGALLLAILIAANHFLSTLTERNHVVPDRWQTPFRLFIATGVLSLLLSPFALGGASKGATQVIGLAVLLLTASAITRLVRWNPNYLITLTRVSFRVLALLATIGILQSIANNVFRLEVSFYFLNDLAGGKVWAHPGLLGPLHRTNSLFTEPAHFCLFLGMGSGLAVMRLGLAGDRFSRLLTPLLSTWSAWAIVIGFVVSLSLLGYLQLLLTVGACWVLHRKISLASLSRLCIRLAAVLLVLYLMAEQVGSEFFQKLGTVSLVSASDVTEVPDAGLSALALASNIEVMTAALGENHLLGIGLGAHPEAYNSWVPSWVDLFGMRGLNQDDGAALTIRLLSETGLLGTLLFVAGASAIWLRSRRSILAAIDEAAGEDLDPRVPIAIGVSASFGSVFVLFLARYGVYYEPLLWLLIGLTASIPHVIKRTRSGINGDRVNVPASPPSATMPATRVSLD